MNPSTPTAAPSGPRVIDMDVPREEIRFGVILNGGVSLAVWMGGAVLELDELTKAPTVAPTGVYATMLALAGCTARADVIAGTSAGGINGAALALAQVNRRARLADLRDIWVDQGRIESLLRQPFRGSPTSLLRGDEFFLPRLNEALGRLAVPHDSRSMSDAPIDLTITTTVLRGNQTVTVDSMGQQLPQSLHAARFRWRRVPGMRRDVAERTRGRVDDPLDDDHIERTAHQMALAARSTASFPVAFEPVFVPVNSTSHREPATADALTEELRLRPDMGGCVVDWGDDDGGDRSRFVVDGGLLANTPTRAALEAVEKMPAAGPVRRVMLLVYPHAPLPGADLPDTQDAAPTVTGTMSGLLGALTAQGSRTFVDELERHNAVAAGRRGTRNDVLSSLDGDTDLDELTVCLFAHFRRLRRWRAGRDLARRKMESRRPGTDAVGGSAHAWTYERTRRTAEEAQVAWQERWGGANAGVRPGMPYVPDTPPSSANPQPPDTWGWGVDGALGVVEGAADLLRRMVWMLPAGPDYDDVERARQEVSRLAHVIETDRELVDDYWDAVDAELDLVPARSYWDLRLAFYDRRMIGTDDDEVSRQIEAVAAYERDLDATRTGCTDGGKARGERVASTLAKVLLAPDVLPGDAGRRVRRHVDAVVACLESVLPHLQRLVSTGSPMLQDEYRSSLEKWARVLTEGGGTPHADLLLTRMLQLEVASTTIGDEVTTGARLPMDLVQLSAQTENAFTRYTRSGDDKLGGMSVNRFGGFLKRSWRVNDWIWGRLDSATVLARTVLQPERVRRAAALSGRLPTDRPLEQARAVVDEVVALLPPDLPADARLERLVDEATAELAKALDLRIPAGDLPSSMPALANLFAWARHLEVVPDELPALAAAVSADRVEGANSRSRGEVFVSEHDKLLTRLQQADGALTGRERADCLAAFDRAGVGREPLTEEVSSDLTLRTATTAAAVTATVLDSGRAGLGAVRPVTRALRGGMMLPYWVVTALTSRAVLARNLALLGLALGGVLLALALFGVLPESLAGPGAAIGASAVLMALAYGALRSGTLLHGLVLLSPVVPLIAYAADRTRADGDAGATAQGVSTLVVVALLSVGLIILGSLPAASGSVWSALDRLADRQGVPPTPPDAPTAGFGRGLRNAARRGSGLLRGLVDLVPSLLVLGGAVAIGVWLVGGPWDTIQQFLRDNAPWLAVVAVAALGVGALAAWRFGRLLQVLRQMGAAEAEWRFDPLAHPVGASAGWAVLYGALYLVLAAVLVGGPESWQEQPWVRALLAMSILLGLGLGLGFPLVAPFLAVHRTERQEIARARTVPAFPLSEEQVLPGADPRRTDQRALAYDLVARGVSYRWLVSDRPRNGEPAPALTRRGSKLERKVHEVRNGRKDQPVGSSSR